MRTYIFWGLMLVSTASLNGMSISGDRITTKAGTISFSELIALQSKIRILSTAYATSTSLIVLYLAYEKWCEVPSRKSIERSSAQTSEKVERQN